jgi:hypothetical protein
MLFSEVKENSAVVNGSWVRKEARSLAVKQQRITLPEKR